MTPFWILSLCHCTYYRGKYSLEENNDSILKFPFLWILTLQALVSIETRQCFHLQLICSAEPLHNAEVRSAHPLPKFWVKKFTQNLLSALGTRGSSTSMDSATLRAGGTTAFITEKKKSIFTVAKNLQVDPSSSSQCCPG